MSKFNIGSVVDKESKFKGLFKYYTAITYDRFKALFEFLHPENFSLWYEKGRTDINKNYCKKIVYF